MENTTPTLEQVPLMVLHLSEEFDSFKKLFFSLNNSPPPESDQLLTIKQAGELICLSVPTIYGLVSRAEIPCMKKSKRLYFSKQELTDWIKSGRKKTVFEIKNDADKYILSKKKKIK